MRATFAIRLVFKPWPYFGRLDYQSFYLRGKIRALPQFGGVVGKCTVGDAP